LKSDKLKSGSLIFLVIVLIALLVTLTACDMDSSAGIGDEDDGLEDGKASLTVHHEGSGFTTPEAGEFTKDEDAVVDVAAEPEEGWKFLGWTGDIESSEAEASIVMNDNKEITAHFLEEDEEGLVFEHRLTLEGDTSNRPVMQVIIKNIREEVLNLQVIGTIYGNQADVVGSDEKIFEFIHYDTLQISSLTGDELNFTRTGKQYEPEFQWHDIINIDEIQIETGSRETIKIEYELVSNYELWEGFGGDLADFEGHSNPAHFWSVFKEWLIMRPKEQEDEMFARNHLHIDLPGQWDYAATYPEADNGGLDLAELKFMRWTNDIEWKNFQRAPLILFHEDSYNINKKTIKGTEVKDVYHKSTANRRNQEANHQFFRFLSEFFGELPVDRAAFFATLLVEDGSGSLKHFDAYASAPYSYGYSSKGRFFGSGADIGTDGEKLDEPQKWSIEEEPDDEYNHLFPIHGTVRMWVGSFIRGHNFSGLAAYAGSQAVASYYTDWDVNKHRYQRKYDFYLDEVVQDNGEEKDISGVTGHNFYGYFKISLAYFYLDELITEKSEGARSLSDAINYLFTEIKQGYDTSNIKDNINLLIEAIDHAAGDYLDEERIETYVKHYFFGDLDEHGHKFLDLSDYLE